MSIPRAGTTGSTLPGTAGPAGQLRGVRPRGRQHLARRPAVAAGGRGWYLEEFGAGWFVREEWMSGEPVRGGSFCVVERTAGRVMACPSSISPSRIMTEYDQAVDRASQISD